ncbi:MAG TPA: hypothetical protein VGC14_15540 [Rhizobium sp.]
MRKATITIRVDEALKADFLSAAKASGSNGAQLLRAYMCDFVQQQREAAEHDAWFRRQVQIGIDSANAGNMISSAEVEEHFADLRAATRRRIVDAE